MPPKCELVKLLAQLVSPKLNPLLPRFLCTFSDPTSPSHSSNFPEPPDLPLWLLHSQKPQTPDPLNDDDNDDDDDDDFVVPSLPNWVAADTHNPKCAESRFLTLARDSDVDKVSNFLKKQQLSTMDGVVEALNGVGVDATNDLVSGVLKRFSNGWVQAFGVFTWAKNQTGYVHTPELYNSMVDMLGKCKKFTLMWDLVKEMSLLNGYVSLVTMSKVIRRLSRAGKYEDAIEAFKGMENFGLRKDIVALNVLMDALVKEGSVENAHSVLMEFKSCIPLNSQSFNILIHGFCKVRKLDDARRIMDEMKQFGFQPDAVSYTCFIEAYCRERDFRKVDATLKEMQEKGCNPSVITYTIIMHALGKAKLIKEALEVYERMKRNGCVPDTSFYASLIFILSKSGRLKDAWDVFEDMNEQGVGRDLLVYNTMVSCTCAHSQFESAIKLLQRMLEDSCMPNLRTYDPLLKMCCRKKTMKVLKFLLNHMFENGVSMDLGTYALLVRGLCKSGKLQHACFFFEEMVKKGMVPWDATYKILVEELTKKNMTEAKDQIEKLMLKAKGQA